MKKNYIFKLTLLLLPITGFILMSNSSGRDDARTGSPGDGGATCAACHSGGNFGATAMITTNIPTTGYLLDTDYTVTLNTTSSSSTHGFQLTAENESDTKIGSFTAGAGSRVTGSRITHSFPSGTGDWTFTWRSPSTDEGKVTFYAAVNAANGTGGITGDQVITTQSSSPSLSISAAKLLKFSMFPNPSPDEITVQLPSGTQRAKAQVYDYTGRLVQSKNITSRDNKVDVRSLSAGMYIVKVAADGKLGAQRFVKN